jgi:hypothetical protein
VAQEVAAVRVADIPDKIEPYLILAACAVVLGQAEEAQRAARKVLALKPRFSLAGR